MAEIDTVAMEMLIGIASSAVTDAGKAAAERLFDRHDPFAALWTEAVDCLEAEEHELRQLHAADVRRAFAAGMIRNTDALSLLIEEKAGIIAERADQLAPQLANTLANTCRDLAVQAAKGSEQAHRVIDQIDHAETKNLLQRLLGLVLDLAERSQLSPPPVEHVIPHMAPPPPANYVGRPAETNALLAALLADSEGRAVGITTALRGAGGFGKTTLAAELCAASRVVEVPLSAPGSDHRMLTVPLGRALRRVGEESAASALGEVNTDPVDALGAMADAGFITDVVSCPGLDYCTLANAR